MQNCHAPGFESTVSLFLWAFNSSKHLLLLTNLARLCAASFKRHSKNVTCGISHLGTRFQI